MIAIKAQPDAASLMHGGVNMMGPQELSGLIDASMARHCAEDRIVDVEIIVQEVLEQMPSDNQVNVADVRQIVMARGVSYPGMRW